MTKRQKVNPFKVPFVLIWYIWFFIINLIILLVFTPYMGLLMLFNAPYKQLYKLQLVWAKANLFLLGFRIKLLEPLKIQEDQTYFFIANHTSLLDIFIMLYIHPHHPFKFIGKQEIVKIPILGWYYKRMSIMVDRSSLRSKRRVYDMALTDSKKGISIGLFPEGGIPDDESIILDRFKDGAFAMSEETKIAIAPYAFYDIRKHMPYGNFLVGGPGVLKVRPLPLIFPEDKTKIELREEAYDIMYAALENE